MITDWMQLQVDMANELKGAGLTEIHAVKNRERIAEIAASSPQNEFQAVFIIYQGTDFDVDFATPRNIVNATQRWRTLCMVFSRQPASPGPGLENPIGILAAEVFNTLNGAQFDNFEPLRPLSVSGLIAEPGTEEIPLDWEARGTFC